MKSYEGERNDNGYANQSNQYRNTNKKELQK